MTLSERIKAYMDSNGLSPEELCVRLARRGKIQRVSWHSLNGWLEGSRKPNPLMQNVLAEELGITTDEMMGGDAGRETRGRKAKVR